MARLSLRSYILFTSILTTQALFATDYVWNDLGTGNWNDNANWTPSGFPNAAGDTATFSTLTTNTSVTLGIPITVGTITFSYASGLESGIVGVETLTFANGGSIQVTSANSPTIRIQVPTLINTSFTANQASTSTFTHESSIGETVAGSALIKTGVGNFDVFTSAAPNTYTGTTTVNDGLLNLSKDDNVISIAGNLTIANSPATQTAFVSATTLGQISSTSALTIQGTGATPTTAAVFNMGSNNTIGSLNFVQGQIFFNDFNLSLNSTGTVLSMGGGDTGSTATLDGNIILSGGSGGTIVRTAGTDQAVINSTNPTPFFQLTGGTYTFNINTNAGDTMTITSPITETATSNITKALDGTLIFNSSGNSYTGLTTVSAGTLQLSSSGIAAPGNVTVSSGATLSTTLANQFTDTVSALTIDGTFNLNGNNQGIGNLSGASTGAISLGAGTLAVAASGTTTYAGAITGTGGLTHQGLGVLVLSNNTGGNTYSGATVSLGGTIRAGANNAFSPNSNYTLDAVSATLDLNNFNETIGLLTSTLDRGVVSLGSGTLTLGNAGNSSFDGVITGTGGITKQGAGTISLTGLSSNTFNGLTTVSAGTLALAKTLGAAVSGNVLINGTGTLDASGNQFGPTTVITLDSATAALSGGPVVPRLIFNAGSMAAVPLITLTSSGTSLTMLDVTIPSNVIFQAATTSVDFNPVTTATISGTINPAGTTTTFNANSGTTHLNRIVAGTVEALVKNGPGTLVFDGTDPNSSLGLTTLNAGTLVLNKPASTTAINAVTINGGTLRTDAVNQIDQTGLGAIVTLNSGTFNLNGNSQVVETFTYAGGTLTGGGATLTLAATNMLNITGGNSISIPLNLGSVIVDPNNVVFIPSGASTTTLSGPVDIAGTPTFNIGHATASPDMLISGVISNNGLIKAGVGVLRLSGANTYTGGTTINAGTLQAGAVNTFPIDSIFTINASGTLDLNSNNQTIDQFSGSGSVTLGSAVLTTGVTFGTVTFSGNISGAGSLVKQNAGTLVLTGTNSYLGGTTVSTGVLQGTATGLQGNILNNASLVFDQATTGTYAGTLTGNGTLTKQNSGNLIISGASPAFTGTTTVSAGRMSVNGALASSAFTVGGSGTLGGTGTITSNVTVNGTLAPGNSIGTISIVGDVIQASGSTLEIEVSPTDADRLNITGSYTIQPGATLLIIPSAGIYPPTFVRTIVDAAPGSLSGTFSNVVVTLPTFIASVTYNAGLGDIILANISELPFATVVVGGNAGAVATCLDTLSAPAGSDLELVIAELRMIPTVEGLTEALSLMQPSQYTALAMAQENATLYTNDTIFQRLLQTTQICPRPCKKVAPKAIAAPTPEAKRKARRRAKALPESAPVETPEICPKEKHLAFWAAPFGALSHQSRESGQVGFDTGTGGVTTGLDFSPSRNWTFGGAVGYSYVHLKWDHGRGKSNMQNGYGALYAGVTGKYAYLFGTAMGSFNHYDASRHMVFGDGLLTDIDRHAKSNHNGWQGSGHMQGGLLFGKKLQFSPFARADYIYVHENSFNEHGANSLDLHVEKKNSDLLQGEAGVEFSRCFSVSENKVSPSLGLSAIREWRFTGKHYKSSFEGSSCVMNTTGMNPDRTLFSGTLGLTILLPDENRTLSFDYKGKWGKEFHDNRLMAQFLIRF